MAFIKDFFKALLSTPKSNKQKAAPKKATPQRVQAESHAQGPYVFITIKGKKFHYDADCTALQNAWAMNKVVKMDLSKARKTGRTACNKCCWDYLHE